MDDATAERYAAALTQVAAAFHLVLEEHGASAAGVGWRDEAGQVERFRILCADMDPAEPVSVNDVGSGLGALFPYLDQRFRLTSFVGTDVCEAMIEAAQARHPDPRARFVQSALPVSPAHWSLASGTFNISVGAEDGLWRDLVRTCLTSMARLSSQGFAFNMLRPVRRDEVIWGDEPEPWATWCEESLGGRARLIEHDGGEEWSLIVRRG